MTTRHIKQLGYWIYLIYPIFSPKNIVIISYIVYFIIISSPLTDYYHTFKCCILKNCSLKNTSRYIVNYFPEKNLKIYYYYYQKYDSRPEYVSHIILIYTSIWIHFYFLTYLCSNSQVPCDAGYILTSRCPLDWWILKC